MMLEAEFEAFKDKFRIGELSLASEIDWTLSLRPWQLTLGSMIISVKKPIATFAEVADGDGFLKLVALAERISLKTFGASKVNVVCLMMQDPIVHFHIIPRYAAPVDRFGLEWIDVDWPKPPNFRAIETQEDILKNILIAARSIIS
jgi:diadenosine tetraphosphate (Ap4A) HIT family hydrolase